MGARLSDLLTCLLAPHFDEIFVFLGFGRLAVTRLVWVWYRVVSENHAIKLWMRVEMVVVCVCVFERERG